VQDKKWESLETRFAQTARLSLSIFCPAQLAVSEVVEVQNQNQNQRPTAAGRKRATVDIECFDVVFDFAFDLPPFKMM